MIHALKTLPEYFEAVWENKKTFELRKNDRDFKVGDYLAFNEWLVEEIDNIVKEMVGDNSSE